MHRKFTTFTLYLACALIVAGCGLRGPLYRPEDREPATQSEASEEKKLRRPRPSPQVQKEDRASEPTPASDQPVAPPDPDRPNTTSAPVEPLPADDAR